MSKKLKALAAVAVCGILAVGGTLAYMTNTTKTANNVFTIGKGVSADVLEPSWAGDENNGVEFTPGAEIAKDPQIKNTSDKESVYVGMRLTYSLPEKAYETYNEVNGTQYASNQAMLTALSYADAEAYIKEITKSTKFNIDKTTITATGDQTEGYWKLMDGKTNDYFYTVNGTEALAIASTKSTEPLFEKVLISGENTDTKDMIPFEIGVTGYVVQTANVDGTQGITELAGLMK